MNISRRDILKGTGVALALPFLPSLSFGQKVIPPKRAGFVYVPHGFIMTDTLDWWTPSDVGENFPLSRTLQPLSQWKDKLTVVSNLRGADGSGQHTGAPTAWLSDAYPKKTQGSDLGAGISIDQVIANEIGQDTIFPSMQLAIEDVSSLVGACDAGYSCAYLDTVSWSSPTTPLPTQINPRTVFERMFGGTGTAEQRLARMQENRSILDSILNEANKTNKSLGVEDRVKLSDFLENIREVERRIQVAEGRSVELSQNAPESPLGIPQSYEEHVNLMFDLLHVAYQADITRVFTFMMARDLSQIPYPQIGVPDPHHSISHHADSMEIIEKHFRVNLYHTQMFAKFVERLANTPEGDGSILDNTLLLYGSGMSNGNMHTKSNLPNALVSGFVKGDRHIAVSANRTVGELHLDIARAMGIPLGDFGRAEGRTVGLT